MARSAKMKGDPVNDGEVIRQAAEKYLILADELDQKRAETKETTGGKTIWRRDCVAQRVDPVILADAVELTRKLDLNPEKVTRDWRVFMGYLQALGFFEKLVPGLFDDFEVDAAEESARSAA